jgi:hypothetical protein
MDATTEALLQPRAFEPIIRMGSSGMEVGADVRIAAAVEALASAMCRIDHRLAILIEEQRRRE